MPSLREILKDPNYVDANPATKAAIFDKWAAKDENYTGANDATKEAIREKFGLTAAVTETRKEERKPEEPESGGIAGFKSSLERMQADYYAVQAARGVEGAEEEAKKHRERADAIYKQPEFLEHPIDYLTGLAGQSVPYMALPIAAGAAVGAGAELLGASALTAGILGTGAAFGAGATQFTGSNLSRQLEEGKKAKDLEVGKAIAASIPQAALDTLSLRMMPGLGRIFERAGINLGERELEEVAKQSIIKRVVQTSGTEGLTESAQQVFERAQAGLNLTDEEARREYFDNFIGGALLGGVIGVPGHTYEKMKAEDTLKAKEYEAEQASKKAQEEATKVSQTAVPDAQGNVALPTYSPLQAGAVAGTNAAAAASNQTAPLDATQVTAAAPATAITNDSIEAAYAANDVSTAKVQKALKPQLEAMGLTTAADQKAFLTAKRDELGIPAYNPKATGVEAAKSKNAKTQWLSNYAIRQELEKGKPSAEQSIAANLAGNQLSANGAPSELGKPATGAATSVAGGVDTSGGPVKPAVTPATIQSTPLEGKPSVTETTEAKQTEEKKQEEKSAPKLTDEQLAKLYEEDVATAKSLGYDIPSWSELPAEDKEAAMPELMDRAKTSGMLAAKGERAKKIPLHVYKQIKKQLDAKVKSGEVNAKLHPEITDLYDEIREDWGNRNGVRTVAWNGLSADEKAIYLNSIGTATPSSKNEVYNALDILTDYREAENPRGASFYETNREAYNRDMPEWASLHHGERKAFLKAIEPGLGAPTSPKTKVTAEQMDAGFKAVVDKYNERAARRAERKTEVNKGRDEQAEQKRQEDKERKSVPEVDTGERLPKPIILQLFKGDIKGVLSYLTRSAKGMEVKTEYTAGRKIDEKRMIFRGMQKTMSRVLFRNLSRVLNTLTFDSKVIMDESNPVVKQLRKEGKLAAYDPKTDTFYFTNDGLDEQTVLHEIVHAATIKILYAYKTNPSSLTQEQREAAEHIEKIYDFAKTRLGNKHKFAFENVYEFVSYAMTDTKLQADLANLQARSLGKYSTEKMSFLRSITSRFGNLWGQFTQALMKMYGLVRAGREFAPAENVQDEILKGFNEENQETLGHEAAQWTWGRRGVIVPRPKDERISKEQIAASFNQAGFEANALVEMSEAFGRVLAVPEAGINLEALPAKKQAKPPIPAPAEGSTDFNKIRDAMPSPSFRTKDVVKAFSASKFTEKAVHLLQNNRAAIKNWQRKLWLTGRYVAYSTGFNNIYDQITLSSGNAHWLHTQYLERHNEAIRKSVADYAKKRNIDVDTALKELGAFAVANHENERRDILYLYEVPLTEAEILTDAKGNTISPRAARDAIFAYLDEHKLDLSGATYLRAQLDVIVNDKKNLDPDADPKEFDRGSQKYSVAGYSPNQIKVIREEYDKHKEEADKVLSKLKAVADATLKLNSMANYMSEFANNYIMFYGFKNYVPFKGKSSFNEDKNEKLNYNGKRLGGDFQEDVHTFEGRLTIPDNPILQIMSDGAQAAMRAGRKDVTQAIYNAVKDKTLQGSIMKFNDKDYVDFKDRKNDDILQQLKGETKIFHYMPDGKVAIIKIDDEKQREAIRRSYRDTNPAVEVILNNLNKYTGLMGQMHTRYKIAFAPVNFVRDVLTNAWTIGAEGKGFLGPLKSFRYLSTVALDVAKFGLVKSWRFAALYSKGKTDVIEKLAETDSYYKDMLDYTKTGGKVSYIQGIAPKGQLQELMKAPQGKLIDKAKIDRFFDIWIDTFEMASRVSAFRIAKADQVADLSKKGNLTEQEVDKAATTTATAYAKNLANFEQVGEWGRALGGLFTFYRPSATGAVRAMDAMAPAFNLSVERAKQSLPEYARAAIIKDKLSKGPTPAEEKKLKQELAVMEKALDTFEENYPQIKTSARIMTLALLGAGVAMYTMARSTGDDDELGRNRVSTDDMSRWTKFARFHIPGFENPIQLPWGYGLGAFAAIGGQIAAMADPKNPTRPTDILGNMVTITLDSFMPLPFSRIPITEKPGQMLIDSITPSILRPAFEFYMNVDALGHQIYNNRQTKYGDAYTGGDNIPESYKFAAKYLVEATNGALNWSPNTMYFFVNNYADGVAAIANSPINMALWLSGKKDFNAHTDTMFLDSFFGSRSNFDARQWSRVEEDLKNRSEKVKMFEKDPVMLAKYLSTHPFDDMLTKMYGGDVQGRLKDLREEANKWRTMRGVDIKTKAILVKNAVMQENMIKYSLVQKYKAFGIEP